VAFFGLLYIPALPSLALAQSASKCPHRGTWHLHLKLEPKRCKPHQSEAEERELSIKPGTGKVVTRGALPTPGAHAAREPDDVSIVHADRIAADIYNFSLAETKSGTCRVELVEGVDRGTGKPGDDMSVWHYNLDIAGKSISGNGFVQDYSLRFSESVECTSRYSIVGTQE
jgi:hypothetical protein